MIGAGNKWGLGKFPDKMTGRMKLKIERLSHFPTPVYYREVDKNDFAKVMC